MKAAKDLQDLKQLYNKDFYKWITENVQLLKNKDFDLVDWENVIVELESMGRSELSSAISFMTLILEHLYKYEHFRDNNTMGNGWIKSILNSRYRLIKIFDKNPSLEKKAEESIQEAWEDSIKKMITWFKYPENHHLAKKYFGKIPTEQDFLKICPYTFQQILEYEPWLKDLEE
ncbi:DUF29 domain-containing protein [Sulfurihydrogenibium sp.]|jgi:hypothetical protein|uniref:DUF29 domain-containing protein n=1 Tax=Sulfurihydrogenibium sp. TaxID=2053621 RepID=UPI002628CD15|nr:DUF29 domain-containing protein [Sulfurihydrogenibium sp.]